MVEIGRIREATEPFGEDAVVVFVFGMLTALEFGPTTLLLRLFVLFGFGFLTHYPFRLLMPLVAEILGGFVDGDGRNSLILPPRSITVFII